MQELGKVMSDQKNNAFFMGIELTPLAFSASRSFSCLCPGWAADDVCNHTFSANLGSDDTTNVADCDNVLLLSYLWTLDDIVGLHYFIRRSHLTLFVFSFGSILNSFIGVKSNACWR